MNDTYTAILKQSGPWWIGWIAEVPGVNCQERTKEELKETLRITCRKRWNSIGKQHVRPPERAMKKKSSPYEATGVAAPSARARLRIRAGGTTPLMVA